MAHTKAKGSTKLGRESAAQRLGIKISEGGIVFPGEIIVRQRGNAYWPGDNVRQGSDDTLYAIKEGKVKFLSRQKISFDGRKKSVKVVTVI